MGKRVTQKRKQEEAASAAASAEIAASRGPSRRQTEGTLRSLRRNLLIDPTDVLNPLSSAAAKRRMIEHREAQLRGGVA